MHCSLKLIVQTLVFSRSYLHLQVSPPETLVVISTESCDFHAYTFGLLYMAQILSTPSEGRRAEDFYALKNPTASAGFEPANFGTKGQHATSRPPKPLANMMPNITLPDLPSNSKT